MARENQHYDENIKKYTAQKQENLVQEAAALILDIQALFHEVFINSLNHYDLSILRRCKTKLSIILKELNIYNLHLLHSQIQHSENGKIKKLTEYPLVSLSFHERSVAFVGEDLDVVRQDNERVAAFVQRINDIIRSQTNHTIDAVRERYSRVEDGCCISILISDNETPASLYEKIDALHEDVRNLSLDELIVAQQFSGVYTVELRSPFWLKAQKNLDAGIRINIHNIDSFAPFYYLSVLLESLKRKIELQVMEAGEQETELDLNYGYDSLNKSYLHLNIKLNLE